MGSDHLKQQRWELNVPPDFIYKKFTDGRKVFFVSSDEQNNGIPAVTNYCVFYYDLLHPGSVKRYCGFGNFNMSKIKSYLTNLLWYANVHKWSEFNYE